MVLLNSKRIYNLDSNVMLTQGRPEAALSRGSTIGQYPGSTRGGVVRVQYPWSARGGAVLDSDILDSFSTSLYVLMEVL